MKHHNVLFKITPRVFLILIAAGILCQSLRSYSLGSGTTILSSCNNHAIEIQPQFQDIVVKELSNAQIQYAPKAALAFLMDIDSVSVVAVSSSKNGQVTRPLGDLEAPYEVGSVMKPLTLAAALDTGAVTADYTYYDRDFVTVSGRRILNSRSQGVATKNISDVINFSLNTGAVNILSKIGNDGLGSNARHIWYAYMTQVYHFGGSTCSASTGRKPYVPPPDVVDARFRYAQTAYGMGLTITPLQLAAAYSLLMRSTETASTTNTNQTSPRTQQGLQLSSETNRLIKQMLIKSYEKNLPHGVIPGYISGGKSGTAPIAQPDGTYDPTKNYGTYIGFVGKEGPRYILYVRLAEPVTSDYASRAAAQVWSNIFSSLSKVNLLR
jgi:cell division protein FtsI/penicillin-binding protein 2